MARQIEEEVLTSRLLVVNARPVLARMQEILEQEKVTHPGSLAVGPGLRYQACLWALNAMSYGDLVEIDMKDEYRHLKQAFTRRDMVEVTE